MAALAARGGRYYGAAVRFHQLQEEPDFRQAVLSECSGLVPEIGLNWNVVEPERGYLSLKSADDLAAFAQENAMKIHGHILLWHASVPPWAESLLGEQQDWALVRRYLSSIIPRYGQVIKQWHVVNEVIETGHREDGLRPNIFLRAFGPGYIKRALEDAHALSPDAYLMINEYGLDYDIAVERDRRFHFLKLLERLKSADVPLHGVGVQGHLDLAKGPFSQQVFASFLRELADLDLFIVISELDVKEHDYALPVGERDRLVAEEVKRYLDVALAEPAVRGVVTWGLSDRHSWLVVTDEDRARHLGAWSEGEGPGLNRGLPLDASMNRKPMYEAIASAFKLAM